MTIGGKVSSHFSRGREGTNTVQGSFQLWKATEDKALAERESWEVVQSGDLEGGFPAWVPWARLHLLSATSSLA